MLAIFARLPEYMQPCLVMTCRRWKGLITGRAEYKPVSLVNLFVYSAMHGEIACMRLAKGWGAEHYNWAFMQAARGGHEDCLRLLKYWGVTFYDWAFVEARAGGHEACAVLLREWMLETTP